MSVASHCPLLNEATNHLLTEIKQIPIKKSDIVYLSGSTGRVLWQPERITDDLAFNMCRTVRWLNTFTTAYEQGVRLAIEMPPGSVLTELASKVMEEGKAIACQQQGFSAIVRLAKHLREQ